MKRLSWVALVCALTVSIGSVFAVQRAAEAAVATTTIQDTAQGTGVGQVQFSSGWSPCSGNCGKAATDNSFQWTSTAGSSVTVRFTGSQIKLYGVKEPWAYAALLADPPLGREAARPAPQARTQEVAHRNELRHAAP